MDTTTIRETLANRLGIERLNPMQIHMESHSRDPFTILLAPTGSGKTVAFTIAMLAEAGNPGSGIQGLIIAPSRELTVQIAEVIRRIATGYKVSAFYGGHSMKEEVQTLAVEPDILVATPGRLLDHLNRNTLSLHRVNTLVLDEWDKTLQLGFADEMQRIFRRITPAPRHLIMTSATAVTDLPPFLPTAAKPVTVDFSGKEQSLTPDQHRAKIDIVEVPSASADKLTVLTDLLSNLTGESSVIFVNHRESAERIAAHLTANGIPAGLYHGALDQLMRSQAIELFANGTTPVLVATDLGARGLDIEGVANVIHYHIPSAQDAWIHRNGRTGRMGASGTVYVIRSDRDTLPDYINFDRTWVPGEAGGEPWRATTATLHFNAGKKDKISRGDIVGFLVAKGGLAGSEIGRIALYDHCALAAIPADKALEVINAVKPHKIKNKRVLVSLIKNA